MHTTLSFSSRTPRDNRHSVVHGFQYNLGYTYVKLPRYRATQAPVHALSIGILSR